MTKEELITMQSRDGRILARLSCPWQRLLDFKDDAELECWISLQVTGDALAMDDQCITLIGCDLVRQELIFEVTADIEDWLSQDE
jgi:hypothetical protein